MLMYLIQMLRSSLQVNHVQVPGGGCGGGEDQDQAAASGKIKNDEVLIIAKK